MKNRILYTLAVVGVLLLASCTCIGNRSQMMGADADKHGCKASAGYTWSEVKGRCIRLFEDGNMVVDITNKTKLAYIVLSEDSTKLEYFDSISTVVLDRRMLPSGKFTWNVEDDDTKNVTNINGYWQVSQRGKLMYEQELRLQDVRWKLSVLNDRISSVFEEDPDTFTVTFTANEEKINGVGMCNTFFGNYSLGDNGAITFTQGGITMMACPNQELENEYINMFGDVAKYSLTNSGLRLFNGKDEVIAIFVK